MSTQLITIWFFLLSLLVTAHAQPVQLLTTTENGLILEFSLPPFEQKTQLNKESLECQHIHIPLWSKEIDQTELPITGALLQVPDTGNIQVRVLASHFETLFPFIPCFSEKNTLSSNELVEIEPRAIWRNVPVARLLIRPFQWHPLTQELNYFTSLQIQIEFEKMTTSDRLVRNKIHTDIYDHIFQNTLINYPIEARTTRENAEQTPNTEILVGNSSPPRLSKQFDSLRIAIKQEGLYRIFYEDLVQSGLNPALIDPSHLQLSNHTQAVAIKVVTQQADVLQSGDYLEFYAPGLDNRFTDTDVYWLHWRRPGQRIMQIDGTVTGQELLADSYYERLHLEENHELWEMTPGAPQQDYFFWNRFNADSIPLLKAYLVKTPAAVLETAKAFNVRVAFQGRSDSADVHPNHHTLLYWKEILIDDEYWDGDVAYLQEARADSSLLQEENSFLIMTPGDTGAIVDTIYLNWIEIEYWRQFVAVNDRLKFNLRTTERTRIEVDGFSQADIKIYDITNPYAISEVINFVVVPHEQQYKVIFADQAPDGKIYYVTTLSQLQRPADLFAWRTNYLSSSKNGADYILITAQDFLSAVEPLRVLRQRQGWRVQVVSVEQIYDEFNQGVLNPVAIKNFLKYAYENWSPPAPSYVFLVGDANTDYRQYLGGDKKSRVPVHLSNDSIARVTPDDNWYVTVEGDDVLPEMMIGRIPGDNSTTVARNIDKIVHYELFASPSPHKVLLIADGKEEYETFNENLFNDYIQPAGFETDRVYTRLYLGGEVSDSIALRQAAEDIRSVFNQHVMLVNYVGHGAVAQWGFSKKFFGMLDVEWLNNVDKLPFVLALTCGNGYPSLPIIYSFADQFVMAPYKGAIGYFSSSSLSQPIGNEMLSNEVFSRIFQQGDRRLGSITMQAKVAAYSKGAPENVMRIYTLFGDPAVVLKD